MSQLWGTSRTSTCQTNHNAGGFGSAAFRCQSKRGAAFSMESMAHDSLVHPLPWTLGWLRPGRHQLVDSQAEASSVVGFGLHTS